MNLEQLTAGMPELVKITGNAQTEIKIPDGGFACQA